MLFKYIAALVFLFGLTPSANAWGKKQEEPKLTHLEKAKLILEDDPGAVIARDENDPASVQYGYEVAIPELEEAVKESTGSVEATYLLGQACIRFYIWTTRPNPAILPRQLHDKAKECLTVKAENALLASLKIDPTYVPSRYALAKGYSLRNKKLESLEQLRSALMSVRGDKKNLKFYIDLFKDDNLLYPIVHSPEYQDMLIEVSGDAASPELKALNLYNKAVAKVTGGELKGDEVVKGLKNLRAAIDLLPANCNERADVVGSGSCPDAIKYTYQAEVDFKKALSDNKGSPILQELYRTAQDIEMENTYALGISMLSEGNTTNSVKMQFKRLITINPTYKDVQQLLDDKSKWISHSYYQRLLTEAVTRMNFYERTTTGATQRRDVQTEVVDKLIAVQNAINNKPEGFDALLQKATALMDEVTKGKQKARVSFAVNWAKVPKNTDLLIGSGEIICTGIKNGLNMAGLCFSLDAPVEIIYSQNAVAVEATHITGYMGNEPLSFTVPANSKWSIGHDNQVQFREQNPDPAFVAFNAGQEFGNLDSEYNRSKREIYLATVKPHNRVDEIRPYECITIQNVQPSYPAP